MFVLRGARTPDADEACGFDAAQWAAEAPAPKGGGLVVVAVQHNGLGNQLFEHAFGRLLARATGSTFAARRVEPRERPMGPPKLAPHSGEGWTAFARLFGAPARPAERRRVLPAVADAEEQQEGREEQAQQRAEEEVGDGGGGSGRSAGCCRALSCSLACKRRGGCLHWEIRGRASGPLTAHLHESAGAGAMGCALLAPRRGLPAARAVRMIRCRSTDHHMVWSGCWP